MTDYPSNSYKSKEEKKTEEKAIVPIVGENDTKIRKKTIFHKFRDAFIAEDLNSVKTYVVKQLIIPGIKRIFLNSLEMLLSEKGTSIIPKNGNQTTISYKDYYGSTNQSKPSNYNYDYLDIDDVIFLNYGKAEEVRLTMIEILRDRRRVTVADFFELAHRQGPYTGNRYGWIDLGPMDIYPVGDGWMIKLPRPIPIDLR